MNAINNMDRIQLNKQTINLLLMVYEYRGKTLYFENLFERDEKAFIDNNLIANTYSLGKYLELDLTDARMKLLAKRDLVAKNKEEQLFLNIKKALALLLSNANSLEMHANEITSLIKLLSNDSYKIDFKKGEEEGEGLTKIRASRVKHKQLEVLMDKLNQLINKKEDELIHLIVNFFVDFNNLHLIEPHSELVSIIMLYGLILQYFKVFKYINFFGELDKIKKDFKNAQTQSNYYWDTGFAQTDMLTKLLLESMIKGCYALDDIAYEYDFEKDLNKSHSIENTILKTDGPFSKNDLRKLHPTISDGTIDRTLRRLRDERKIIPLGKGRSARWQLIVESRKKEYTKLSIFD